MMIPYKDDINRQKQAKITWENNMRSRKERKEKHSLLDDEWDAFLKEQEEFRERMRNAWSE